MSVACGCSSSRAVASISSVVVSPLPHSFTMSRKGALVMPAMGAMRASERTSTGPIFIGLPVYRVGARGALSPSGPAPRPAGRAGPRIIGGSGARPLRALHPAALEEGPDLTVEHLDVGREEA